MLVTNPRWLGRAGIARTGRLPVEIEAECFEGDFDKVEREMVDELNVRRKLAEANKTTDDGLRVNEWLRSTCYEVILAFLTIDEGEALFERLDRYRRFVRGSRRERDVFQEGVVAIFAQTPSAIMVRDRERLALPMWHGFRHYIPPALLLGFNDQYPAHVAQLDGWRDRVELSLEGWVTDQRAISLSRSCPLDTFRGRYPKSIEAKVDADQESIREAMRRHDASVIATASTRQNLANDDDDWPE